MKLSEEIINSLKDNKEGLGAKRLTTLNFVIMVVIWHTILFSYIIWGKDEYKVRLAFDAAQWTVYADFLMILLLLAIITVPQVIELINTFRGNKNKENEQPTA
jgi:hypothetical protein